MTQPTAINQTFDTSLIDIQQYRDRSFSSTDTGTSGSETASKTAPTQTAPTQKAPAMADQSYTAVSNDQLYDEWARTYDTDGNVLQAVDDLELKTLLPEFVRLASHNSGDCPDAPLRILDFGCGTGRNTLKLLQADWQAPGQPVEVHGWDGSGAMLEIARKKCTTVTTSTPNVQLSGLQGVDFSSPSNIPSEYHGSFDGILSTLVLEHLPLPTFISHLSSLLKPAGVALVTNMHPDMGSTTRAGYKTASGERVKGDSYAHGVEESAKAAEEAGLTLVSGLKEAAVDEEMLRRGDVGRRGRKWIGTRVWYGFMVRKRSE